MTTIFITDEKTLWSRFLLFLARFSDQTPALAKEPQRNKHDAVLLSQKAWSEDWDSDADAHWDSYGV